MDNVISNIVKNIESYFKHAYFKCTLYSSLTKIVQIYVYLIISLSFLHYRQIISKKLICKIDQ